jgi:hypothetical protein
MRVPARLEVNVFKVLGLSLIMVLLVCSHSALGQILSSEQQRIPQSVIVNGQQVQGVMVVQNGTSPNLHLPITSGVCDCRSILQWMGVL